MIGLVLVPAPEDPGIPARMRQPTKDAYRQWLTQANERIEQLQAEVAELRAGGSTRHLRLGVVGEPPRSMTRARSTISPATLPKSPSRSATGKRMQDLADVWGCSKHNVYDLFYRDRPISPNHIELAAQMLDLDEFDTNELRLLGAREAGWHIDINFLLEESV